MESPDGEGWAGSRSIGRYVRMQVRVCENKIVAASFESVPCVFCISCGSFLAEWAHDKPIEQLSDMDAYRLAGELGGLPRTKFHCAELAVHALSRAVKAALGGGSP